MQSLFSCQEQHWQVDLLCLQSLKAIIKNLIKLFGHSYSVYGFYKVLMKQT